MCVNGFSDKPQPGMGVLPQEWLQTAFLSSAVRRFCNAKDMNAFSLQYGEPAGDVGLRRAVSHKLKTPLVAIRGFTPMLLEKPEELTSFQKTAIETIDRNSQQLASLVEKLMWFAALEGETLELTRKPYSVATILDMALSDLAPFLRSTEAHIGIDESVNKLPLLSVDRIWMKEALRNLIENAVKFNSHPPPKVLFKGRLLEGRVEILISDNGPGIPSEERDKIFNKFYQIEGSFTGQVQGMGLGLALVKRVVDEHGGRITVESELGHGSTFLVSLPQQ